MSADFTGCGAPATLIVFRGTKKRSFLCSSADCRAKYTGKGKVAKYEVGDALEGHTPKTADDTFVGAFQSCGDTVGA